jgi:hypothetical protein
MDLSIYAKDFTQHDLFGLFPGAAGGRALRDMYGRVYLVTIAAKGGRTTLERYGRDYMRELASRGGKAKRHKQEPSRATLPTGMAPSSGMSPIARPEVAGGGHISSDSFLVTRPNSLVPVSQALERDLLETTAS